MKCLNMLCGSGHHKVGLTRCKVGPCHFKVPLVLLDLDCKVGDIIINLPVPRNFSCQAPIVSVSHCGLEDVEVTTRASEHMPEPRR
jgi:hypothetical protein